jgi:hypothetical protein
MKKLLVVWMKVFLLSIFGLVFAFGISEPLIFAEEIQDFVFGIPRYEYRLSDSSPDWDTFYRRCNQYAGQYRYYAIEVDDDHGSNRIGDLYMYVQDGGNSLRFLYGNDGVMVTMWFLNQPLPRALFNARHFTNYAEALRYWKDVVQTMR